MPHEGASSPRKGFVAFRRRFVAEAAGDVREMARILERAAGRGPEGEERRRFRTLAHNLSGMGGTVGFAAVSARAGELERACVAGAGRGALAAALAALEASLGEAGAGLGDPAEAEPKRESQREPRPEPGP